MAYTFDPKRGAWVAPGSETSEEAASHLEASARSEKLESLVYEAIKQAGPTGLADFEIDQALQPHLAPGATARPRRCRLRDAGAIRDTGETVRNPATNRSQSRWALAVHVPDTPQAADNGLCASRAEQPNPGPRTPVERVLQAVEEDLSVCRTFWHRPDMHEADRLERMALRLEKRVAEFRLQANNLRRQEEFETTGQSSFALGFDPRR